LFQIEEEMLKEGDKLKKKKKKQQNIIIKTTYIIKKFLPGAPDVKRHLFIL